MVEESGLTRELARVAALHDWLTELPCLPACLWSRVLLALQEMPKDDSQGKCRSSGSHLWGAAARVSSGGVAWEGPLQFGF